MHNSTYQECHKLHITAIIFHGDAEYFCKNEFPFRIHSIVMRHGLLGSDGARMRVTLGSLRKTMETERERDEQRKKMLTAFTLVEVHL